MNDIINKLNVYFGQKAPQIPKDIKEILVKIAPWLAVISLIVALPTVFAFLNVGRMAPWAYMGGYGSTFGVLAIVNIAVIILYVIALPGLFKRNASGWNFSFYAVIASAIGSLVTLQLVGLVVTVVVGFYILFQIKPYYFGQATITETPTTTSAPTNTQQPQTPPVSNQNQPPQQ